MPGEGSKILCLSLDLIATFLGVFGRELHFRAEDAATFRKFPSHGQALFSAQRRPTLLLVRAALTHSLLEEVPVAEG